MVMLDILTSFWYLSVQLLQCNSNYYRAIVLSYWEQPGWYRHVKPLCKYLPKNITHQGSTTMGYCSKAIDNPVHTHSHTVQGPHVKRQCNGCLSSCSIAHPAPEGSRWPQHGCGIGVPYWMGHSGSNQSPSDPSRGHGWMTLYNHV